MNNFDLFNKSGNTKLIHCNIHGPIRLSPVVLQIINTPEFQRLRDIKQLSCVYLVYPSATHTRYEHSLGVYYLARHMMERIRKSYPHRKFNIPILGGEIELDNFVEEMVVIAGLCHDIGHGPFAHTFDDIFLKSIDKTGKSDEFIKMCKHENRSCKIIEEIIKRELSDIFEQKHIDFIKSLIHPSENDTGAIYQIISNSLNGIDVDKFDYLVRDSHNIGIPQGVDIRKIMYEFIIDENNNICYPKHCSRDIYMLFNHRYMMHRTVYTHKTAKIIEHMILDILNVIEKIFNISESITNMQEFCRLTDHSIMHMIDMHHLKNFSNLLTEDQIELIEKANQLLTDLRYRNLYKQVSDVSYGVDGSEEMINEFFNNHPEFDKKDFHIIKYKIGLVSGNQPDPFCNIFFYDRKEDPKTFTMERTSISPLISKEFQENVCFFICKNHAVYQIAKNAWSAYSS